jgi:hypothetical protein
MSDERFRRELNQIFDDMAGSPSSNLRDRVHTAVSAPPDARGQYWIAAVAAAVIAVLLVGVLVVSGPLRGSHSPVGAAHSTPSPSASASASPSSTPSQLPAYACQAQDFVVKATTQASTPPPVVYISAIRTGSHTGYDRVTIEFANGIPQDVTVSAPSSGTTFTMSPSGQQATLKGDHGILITIHGSDLHTSYSGSTDMITDGPTIAEVRRVQDFEGVVQLGLGVNGTGCYRAFWMTNPDRLVIDVQQAA